MRRICFVCTGNTCRSPMAEAVANACIFGAQSKPAEVRAEAFSRGLYAHENEPISRGALDALESAQIPVIEGHDYRKHTAHTLTEQDVASFDLLIGMTASHAMEMMMRFPQAAGRITCMPQQIADPYGGDAETYRACLEQIRACVGQMLGTETDV